MRRISRVSLTIAGCACIAVAARAQAVHVLTNGSGAALQSAIDAALDGDTLLLHGGSFADVHVVDRSLSIVSEPEHSTTIQRLDVRNVSAGKRVVLSGLRLVTSDASPTIAPPVFPQPALALADCSGSVRLERVRCLPFVADSGADGVRVASCADVAFLACEISGGAQRPPNGFYTSGYFGPGLGLWISGPSQVALYDTSVVGGEGARSLYVYVATSPQLRPATAGANAVRLDDGTLFLGRSSARGGDGGDGVNAGCSMACGLPASDGAAGGVGVLVAAVAQAFAVDVALVGGRGGYGGNGATCAGGACHGTVVYPPASSAPDGAPASGALSMLAGSVATLEATALVRELQSITVSVDGTPGDFVTLATSQGTRFLLEPALEGVFLYGPGVRRFGLGTIPGSGTLSIALPVALLPAGVQTSTRHLQLFVRDPSGASHLGSAGVVTIVGQGF